MHNYFKASAAEFITELVKWKWNYPFQKKPNDRNLFQGIKKATEIKTKIGTTDQEIDKMVYALYELKNQEIGIVEG